MDGTESTESAARPIPPTALIVCAAGAGTRMRSDTKKPYLALAGRPVLFHTLARFRDLPYIQERILVVAPDDVDRVAEGWPALREELGVTQIVAGGAERVDSVWNGVQAITADPSAGGLVAVHDGVRPFVTPAQIEAVCGRAAEVGGAILATRATDTIKQTDPAGDPTRIQQTLPRAELWAAQTPQVFDGAIFREAYARWIADGRPPVTDDASLLERIGRRVDLVEGDRGNLKITTPDDMAWAEIWLARHNPDPPAGSE